MREREIGRKRSGDMMVKSESWGHSSVAPWWTTYLAPRGFGFHPWHHRKKNKSDEIY